MSSSSLAGIASARGETLRVALVAACEFPSERGSQALIAGVAEALRVRGHRVHTVAYTRALRASGPSVRRLVDDVSLLGSLYRVVRKHDIDVMHAHNYEAAIAACLVRAVTKVPVVYHAHNVMSDELQFYTRRPDLKRVVRRFGAILDRTVPRQADHTIVLNRSVATFLRECNVSADRLSVLPPMMQSNGAPMRDSAPSPAAEHFTVLYAGNLDPYQGLETLVAGFEMFSRPHPDALLLLVTHEPDWSRRIEPRLAELLRRGRAAVLCVATFAEVVAEIRRADVVTCPRPSWSGFPMKLLNYLSAGKPVVATVSASNGLCHDESGLLFADGDAGGLAAALERLYADAGLRARLAEGGDRLRRQLPDLAATAARLESIYQSVLSSRYAARTPVQDC